MEAQTFKVLKLATADLCENDPSTKILTWKCRKDKNKDKDEENKDYGLYKVIMVSCHVAKINSQYDNPSFDSPCSEACGACAKLPICSPPTMLQSCNCSGCDPGPLEPPPARKILKKQIPIHLQVPQDQYFNLLHEFCQILLESCRMLEFHSDSTRMVGIKFLWIPLDSARFPWIPSGI